MEKARRVFVHLMAAVLVGVFVMAAAMPAFAATTAKGKWYQSGNGAWWYHYDSGGNPQGSWEKIDDKWYYFNDDGYAVAGWQKISERWYYFDASCAMITGWWVSPQNLYYYFDSGSGAMAEGWRNLDGKWYYFYPGYGHMAVNTYIDGYYINAAGVWQ
ncbi:MAG: hypothetical protein LBR77_10380 [Lachnospiraceae bacterium]|jgi:glucan-binding repeat-containing protein|nr:hypothetical protein [Lachnospiraceae bacterium]